MCIRDRYLLCKKLKKSQTLVSRQMRLRYENAQKAKDNLKSKIKSYKFLQNIIMSLFIIGLLTLLLSILNYMPTNKDILVSIILFVLIAGIFYLLSHYSTKKMWKKLYQIDEKNQKLGRQILNNIGAPLTELIRLHLLNEKESLQKLVKVQEEQIEKLENKIKEINDFSWCEECKKNNSRACQSQCLEKYFIFIEQGKTN
eukprot:TRINITY_DN13504_c0_g1_i3.p2 TRINITY_DN13504_c0_g1~~TRINITY_DN13504_c0_g1_i3.p2  ORF type:complete len:200 (+),score=37.78 TRINITY_DN13504_c0_g1_i3:127-726(+)